MICKSHDIPGPVTALLRRGAVLPAHPLALDRRRQLDAERQRALARYYIDAGAGGLAVGVHTTQFAIREHGLYEPVLRIAAETVSDWTDRPMLLVAGVTGLTKQAVQEAAIARALGFHAVLLNVARLRGAGEAEVLEHCKTVAAEMPVIGFSLLPACGGFHLSYEFWRAFAEIENVIAIKMAPFDRYRTIDIVRAVVDAGAEDRISLYTGNDDHIVLDLLAPFVLRRNGDGDRVTVRIKGGLLGHWSVWTSKAAALLTRIHAQGECADLPFDLAALDSIVTDCNGAIYDAMNDFRGCIPGCLEVLRRQGLVRGTWCLDAAEMMSPGQAAAIDRVYGSYPEMNDDAFVTANLHRWLSERGRTMPLVA
jgi:hypothetical protein